ncbi:unnamed protein product [Orchesella dallaii]|uniref:Methyl farnesoate epoxidase n=1 Tax=Orchesella dallaii TaxID=48710 RepID=A0ABP1R1D6_9HEXA
MTVLFTSHETIVEIFNHEKASAKAPELIPAIYHRVQRKNIGLIWGNGEPWQVVRRFTIRTLRDFGFGKTASMDGVVNEELDKFTDHVNKLIDKKDGILEVESFFDLTVINVLWRLVTGVNYELEDARMLKLLKMSNDMTESSNFSFDLSISFPFLREWFPELLFGKKIQDQIVEDFYQFGEETIKEHRDSGTYKTSPQSFVDVFLEKIDKHSIDPATHFNDDQLRMTLIDLFQAGAETTSKTLSFGLLYMLLHQEVQEKVQKEIDSVIPKGSPLFIAMKTELPYTNAAILETLRYSTVVPFPPMRKAAEDFYFRGYFIKKNTALLPNVYAAHFCESIWGDPHRFRPERFLTLNGEIDQKLADFVIPFGGGKRACLGQSLAETTLFMYFVTVLRFYKISMIPGKPKPTIEPKLGMTYGPQPFTAWFERR